MSTFTCILVIDKLLLNFPRFLVLFVFMFDFPDILFSIISFQIDGNDNYDLFLLNLISYHLIS